MEPSLNNQMNSDVITLFKSGMAWKRNPKCTVNSCLYDTHSVYIYFDKDF